MLCKHASLHLTYCPPTRKALGKPKLLCKHASLETGREHVKTHNSEDGKYQAWHAFASLSSLAPPGQQSEASRGSMHVAVERCKMCTGHAYQPEGFHVRTPQQQSKLTRKHSASLPASKPNGAPLTDLVSANKKGSWQTKVALQSCFLSDWMR